MIDNVEQTILILRPEISRQAEIPLTDIINADSIRGAELTKMVNGEKIPYQPNDNIIVFDLQENQSLDVNETLDNGEISSIASYQMHLVIYGDKARTTARVLKARLLSSKVIQGLSRKGISITKISSIEPSTEMINTTRYIRRDMTISFISEMVVKPIDVYTDLEITSIEVKNN